MSLSNSTAVTFLPRLTNLFVKEPKPGPISIISSVLSKSKDEEITSNFLSSIKKFCENLS